MAIAAPTIPVTILKALSLNASGMAPCVLRMRPVPCIVGNHNTHAISIVSMITNRPEIFLCTCLEKVFRVHHTSDLDTLDGHTLVSEETEFLQETLVWFDTIGVTVSITTISVYPSMTVAIVQERAKVMSTCVEVCISYLILHGPCMTSYVAWV